MARSLTDDRRGDSPCPDDGLAFPAVGECRREGPAVKPPRALVNGRARRARKDRSLRERLLRLVPEEYVHFTHEQGDVDGALTRLRDLGIEQLVLVGGDGTVGGTLTPLLRIFADRAFPAVTLAL